MNRSIAFLLGALLASGCTEPSPTTGGLVITVSGLPAGANASVRISGPTLFSRLITTTTTLEDLEPGAYIVRSDTVLFSNTRFGVDSVAVVDTIQVTRGTSQSKAASYHVASGSIALAINGLPSGIPADIRITGPNYLATITSAVTIAGLVPGQYIIASDTMISIQGDHFGASAIRDTVTVTASVAPVSASVDYTLVSGSLAVTVTGLPTSFDPITPITVTGPNAYRQQIAYSTTLRGLRAGAYTISAVNTHGTCPNIYTTSSAPQSRDVVIGSTTDAAVVYSESQAPPQDLNLRVDAVHAIQVTQDYTGTVPMIAGKPALLRIFGLANQCNSAQPQIRVTINGGAPILVSASETSVRRLAAESLLVATWNVNLPGTMVQPGLTVVAEIDPNNAVAEANEADNRFPASGAKTIDVRTGPTVGLRLVPITHSVSSTTGNVTMANLDAHLDLSRKLHPVAAYDVDIRDPYTTSLAALGSQGANWSALLSEINALRVDDQSNRYYYGIAKVTYQSGVAGIAYVPGKAGLGWDYLPTGSEVMAHELGHNFGRSHTPCGGPSGVDPNYPSSGFYSGGKVGTYGYDIGTNSLKQADLYTDIMGYCNQKWISDYTYVGMFNYLTDPSRGPSLPIVTSSSAQPSLLIWGRIENGVPVLEPAFEVSARAQMPGGSGPNRITAVDNAGAEIFGLSFAGQRIADLPGEHETFAFVVPLSALRGRTLASLRLTSRGQTVTSGASSDVAADPRAVMTRSGSRAVRLRWDAMRFPVVMVRDANGQVLSFARGGDATVRTDRSELELNFSNRVRSSRRLERIR
jgi:hypothetical protein